MGSERPGLTAPWVGFVFSITASAFITNNILPRPDCLLRPPYPRRPLKDSFREKLQGNYRREDILPHDNCDAERQRRACPEKRRKLLCHTPPGKQGCRSLRASGQVASKDVHGYVRFGALNFSSPSHPFAFARCRLLQCFFQMIDKTQIFAYCSL